MRPRRVTPRLVRPRLVRPRLVGPRLPAPRPGRRAAPGAGRRFLRAAAPLALATLLLSAADAARLDAQGFGIGAAKTAAANAAAAANRQLSQQTGQPEPEVKGATPRARGAATGGSAPAKSPPPASAPSAAPPRNGSAAAAKPNLAAAAAAAAASSRPPSAASAASKRSAGKTPPAKSAVAAAKPAAPASSPKAAAAAPAPAPAPIGKQEAKLAAAADTTAVTKSAVQAGLKSEVAFYREVFSYQPGGRRDPFVSLLASGDLRPALEDLRLVAVAYDPTGRNSVAIMRDVVSPTKDQYRVKVGQTLGRMRVTQIHPKSVSFTIEEFGYSRPVELVLGDSTKVRTP